MYLPLWIPMKNLLKMKAIELVRPIEELAPLQEQEKWDNCGFSVGDPGKEVTKALIALDCTEEVVDEAIEIGADIIITHHPLIFGGVKKISPENRLGRMIFKAIRSNIAIYAAHTNMDKAEGGVNTLMADKLSLIGREYITPDNLGIIGNLPQEMDAVSFVGKVKEAFGADVVRTSAMVEGKVKRVAVSSGSGKGFIRDAMAKGAQVYITGDIPYHDFQCEEGFMVMDIGHYYSEYGIVDVFANILSKKFPNFAVSKSTKNNNPIYYY